MTLPPLSELRRIAEAATRGPWRASDVNSNHFEVTAETRDVFWVANCHDQPNTDHIATFNPQTVIALLDRIEELENEVAGFEHQIEAMRDT